MRPFQTSSGVIFDINRNFLASTLFGIGAWWLWPEQAYWWGFAAIAVFLAFASFQSLVKAVKSIWTLYAQDRAVADILAMGKQPKSAELASDDVLRKSGMIDE